MKWKTKQCWRRIYRVIHVRKITEKGAKKIFTCSDAYILKCIAKNVSLMFLRKEGAEAHRCELVPFTRGRGEILHLLRKGEVWVSPRGKSRQAFLSDWSLN